MKRIAFAVAFMVLLGTLAGCVVNDEDRDGDGLTKENERQGWEVHVVYPHAKNTTTYHVTSDPNKKDTDGDGLTDYEEFLYPDGRATDPNKKDTDGDGLTDYEEFTLGTNPIHWQHDLDDDGFIDYDEITYYKQHGITHEKILDYIQTQDVDGDGVPDGYDRDPLRDLRVEVRITEIMLMSYLDSPDDGIIEGEINISFDNSWVEFEETLIPRTNQSFNLSHIFDLTDFGVPGDTNAFSIVIKDSDEGEGLKAKSFEDGIPEYDFARLFEGNQPVYAVNFDILTDCTAYHTWGTDGELWFEVIDRSVEVDGS
ncbi:MAG TPA: hypothetical protein ENG06_00135 [Thermoplasmatales archaeon]|nr:hypothetical protein [Thermoplasmatales archaeon]